MASRQRSFTATVVLVLALCIGTNTAIFTLINTVMLRVLPVHDPKQLAEVLSVYPGEPPGSSFSQRRYQRFRQTNHVFTDLIGTSAAHFEVSSADTPTETMYGEYVTSNFFPVLGVRAAIGRLIGPHDDVSRNPEDPVVAVLGWSYWNTRFHDDPDVVGRHIVIDQTPAVVIGVAPRDFFGLQVGANPAFWMLIINRSTSLRLMGRLKNGVSLEQARAEMRVLDRARVEELAERSPDPLIPKIQIDVEPGGTGFSLLRNRFGKPLMLLTALSGLLLVLACSSLTTMLLTRESARRKEMALRVALGAGRMWLMQQVLTESLLLSFVSGLAGILIAFFFGRRSGAPCRIGKAVSRTSGTPGHCRPAGCSCLCIYGRCDVIYRNNVRTYACVERFSCDTGSFAANRWDGR